MRVEVKDSCPKCCITVAFRMTATCSCGNPLPAVHGSYWGLGIGDRSHGEQQCAVQQCATRSRMRWEHREGNSVGCLVPLLRWCGIRL